MKEMKQTRFDLARNLEKSLIWLRKESKIYKKD